MSIKKGELDLQKRRNERLENALNEVEQKKEKIGENYEEYKSYVKNIIKELNSYEDDLKIKIIDMTGKQKLEYMQDEIKRKKKIQVRPIGLGNVCSVLFALENIDLGILKWTNN